MIKGNTKTTSPEELTELSLNSSDETDTEFQIKGFGKMTKTQELDKIVKTLLQKAKTEKTKQKQDIDLIYDETKNILTQITELLIKYNRSQAKAIGIFSNMRHE